MKKIMLMCASLFTGCGGVLYEYHEFEGVREKGLMINFTESLKEAADRVVYGNPYSVNVSIQNKEAHVFSYSLLIQDDSGKFIVDRSAVDKGAVISSYNWFTLFDENFTLKEEDHYIKFSSEVRNLEGKVIDKRDISKKITYNYRKETKWLNK